MSEVAYIANELKEIHDGNAWHGLSLVEALDGITPEQAAATSLPNTHSIWEIVSHITGWENVFRLRLEGMPAIEPEEGDFPAVKQVSQQVWAETLAQLENTHEQLIKVIKGLSDSKLDEMVAGKDYSVRFLLHAIVRHHVYHAGQIALLRKAFV